MKQKLILLVSGDEATRSSLAAALRQGGFEVACAKGSEEALARLQRTSPVAVVLLDCAAPGAPGLAQAVASRAGLPSLVSVSASESEGISVRFQGALPRGVDQGSFLEKVVRALEAGR
ncbi:MAG: response regulator [Myxococcales bacterium]|nr:response regulator [Myxococcales bacterium]